MIALLFAASLTFSAEEIPRKTVNLEWAPEHGEAHDYRFTSTVRLAPDALGVTRVDVTPERVAVRSRLDMRCEVETQRTVEFLCTVTDASVATSDRAVDVLRAVTLAERGLVGAAVDIGFTPSGRVVNVDVRPLGGSNDGPLVRHLVDHAVAGLDLELPSSTVETPAWTQSRSAMLPDVSASGPLGRIKLNHAVTATHWNPVQIDTTGELWWLHSNTAVEAERRTTGTVNATALFDAERGIVVHREWTTTTGGERESGRVELLGAF